MTTLNTSNIPISNINPIYSIRKKNTKNEKMLKEVEDLKNEHYNKIKHLFSLIDQPNVAEHDLMSKIITISCFYCIIKSLMTSKACCP